MLQTTHPVEEKMALLWHGHFATHENKVRDYRKMHQQIELFERYATGNLLDLTDRGAPGTRPCSTSFDAQYNVKGAPNENFAREVMELFTMGVGNYTGERTSANVRARFTGWYFDDLTFKVDPGQARRWLQEIPGPTGNFDGVEILKDHLRATRSPRSSWPRRSIASSCATRSRRRCADNWGQCCATRTTR
jgi:hypothetical protein